MKIVIVDYGMGNIKSLVSTLQYLGADDVLLSSEYDILKSADKIILPGVGSFAKAMSQIKQKKLDVSLQDIIVKHKKPLLGICLGMQLLGRSSSEDGQNAGLGFVKGDVVKFDNSNLKVPHVGFNQVKINSNLKLYAGFSNAVDFYFTHSYKMVTDEVINQCYCDYGGDFVASFETGHIAGVQFHPELSQHNGLNLFRNFIDRF